MDEPKLGRRRRGRPGGSAPPPRGGGPTRARLLAVRVITRVESAGAYADRALHGALRSTALASRDRALVTELVYGTLRWRGRLDFLLGAAAHRDVAKLEPRVATLLRVGAYQLLFSDRIPAASAVDESVRCAHAIGADRAAGLVNAVLRRLAAKKEEIAFPELARDPVGHLEHALSLPGWIARRWIELFGAEDAARLAEASNAIPPLTLRTNPLRGTREDLLAELRTRLDDARPTRWASLGIRLGHRGEPGRDAAFLAGRFTVQDEASQLVVEVLGPEPGERILDVCAAPGTKTTAIAERIGAAGRVLAIDKNPRRLRLLGRDARRLALPNVSALAYDAVQPLDAIAPPASFDRVLVDAPCSGLGTLRRHPDARWRLRPEDPARLAEVQAAILRNAAAALRPGGVLVYSTCTLLPEENEAIVEGFLSQAPEFGRAARDELPERLRELVGADAALRTLPHVHDTDGFFAARLERTA